MTPIYDALRAAPLRPADAGLIEARVAEAGSHPPAASGRPELRLVPMTAPASSASALPAPAAPHGPTAFPARVLSSRRTPPWQAGLLP